MSDFMNRNDLQCSVNSTITGTSNLYNMNRLMAFVCAFVVNFVIGFGLIVLTIVFRKRTKMTHAGAEHAITLDPDYDLLQFMPSEPHHQHYRSISCVSTLKRFKPLQDPSTLNTKQLEDITENEDHTESEKAIDYDIGGYMPVDMGDKVGPSRQYEIIRKLGWGHFSTVWLSKDLLSEHGYFAIKITKASSVYKNVALDEISLLKCVKNKDPNSVGYNRVILLHEYFTETSINGAHICLVFEIMGPSLLELLLQSNFHGIDQPGVKRIIKQVLEGLVYLHEVCKIIHTDIKPENILITIKDSYLNNMVAYVKRFRELGCQMPKSYVSAIKWDEHVELYGQPGTSSIPPPPTEHHRPREVSWPENIYMKKTNKRAHQGRNSSSPYLSFVDPNIQVKIADLGNACWENHHFASLIQTVQYRALEVIIDADYSFPADLWSVACVAFELSTGEYLFNPHGSQHLRTAEDHLGLIWEVLDGIPKYIALSGRESSTYFHPSGALKNIRQESLKIWKVEDVLVDKYGWKRMNAISFAEFIQGLIEPDPELRATASAALNSRWLKELEN